MKSSAAEKLTISSTDTDSPTGTGTSRAATPRAGVSRTFAPKPNTAPRLTVLSKGGRAAIPLGYSYGVSALNSWQEKTTSTPPTGRVLYSPTPSGRQISKKSR